MMDLPLDIDYSFGFPIGLTRGLPPRRQLTRETEFG